jgi:tetratricopeptide (TPR) repeat protein
MLTKSTSQLFQTEAEVLLRTIEAAWPRDELLLAIDRANRTALRNWLKLYQSPANSGTLEQVKHFLETFYHLCSVHQWQLASRVLAVAMPEGEFHNQLGIWGHFQEQIQVYQQLIERISPTLDLVFLNGLGTIYFMLKDCDRAMEYFNRCLEMSRNTENLYWQGSVLGNLASVHNFLGRKAQAIRDYEESLQIASEIEDWQMQSNALGNLGVVYREIGQFQQALTYHQQDLALSRQLHNQHAESYALANIGLIYFYWGNYAIAEMYYQQDLELTQLIQDD